MMNPLISSCPRFHHDVIDYFFGIAHHSCYFQFSYLVSEVAGPHRVHRAASCVFACQYLNVLLLELDRLTC